MSTSEDQAADALVAYVRQNGGSLHGAQVGGFYNLHPEFKDFVHLARAAGHLRGVASFVTLHKSKLSYRRVDGHPIIFEGAASALPDTDAVGRAAAKVAMGDCDSMLEALETELEALKLTGKVGSMRKLGEVVKDRGICLTTGHEYGSKLCSKLRENSSLRVNKREAKEYRHARKCLIAL